MNVFVLFIVTMTYIELAASQTDLRWNKRSKFFEAISNASMSEAGIRKIMLKNERPDVRDFNGQPLRISYFEKRGIFEYYDKDTKVKGIFGEIWTTVCSFLNFTMILTKNTKPFIGENAKNGSYIGILGKAWLNETDVVPHLGMVRQSFRAVEFSPVFWMHSVRIYSRGQWKRNPAWMFNIFTQDVWITLLAFLVTLSLANIVTQRIMIRYRGKNLKSEGILNYLFYNFATLCNQPGSSSNKAPSGSNLLNVVIVIFAYLLLAAYNSRLIFSLAQESFAAPFSDLDTLMDKTKYRIIVLNGTIAHHVLQSPFAKAIFGQVQNSPRLQVVQHANDLYTYVCNYPDKYVFLDTDDEVAVRKTMECDVEPVGPTYATTPVASGFSHGFQPSKTIKFWLLKFREAGLLDAMKKRYMTPATRKLTIRHAQSLTIDMDRVSVIFGVLVFGMIGSIIICVAENIIFTINKRKTNKLLDKKMLHSKQPIVAKLVLQNRVQATYRK